MMPARIISKKKALIRVAIFAASTACIVSIQFMRNRPPSADYTQSVKDIFSSASDPIAPPPPAFVADLQPARGTGTAEVSPNDARPLVVAPPLASETKEIVAGLSHIDASMRLESLMQIIRLGLRIDESLGVSLANDPNPEVRTVAILALGIQSAPMGLILKSLEDSDDRVRFAGYQAMGYYPSLKALRVLFGLPKNEHTRPLLEESLNRILFPASSEGVKSESAMVATGIP